MLWLNIYEFLKLVYPTFLGEPTKQMRIQLFVILNRMLSQFEVLNSSTTYINRISNISFVHQSILISLYFHNSWRKVWNFVEEKFLGIFTKIGITFSYGIRITKFLVHWKACYTHYVIKGSRFSFGLYIIYSYYDIQKGVAHAFGFLL